MRMEVYIAICLDIDRDAPFPIHGVSHGVCLPYHNLSSKIWKNPTKFTIEATVLGLKKLFKLHFMVDCRQINRPIFSFTRLWW